MTIPAGGPGLKWTQVRGSVLFHALNPDVDEPTGEGLTICGRLVMHPAPKNNPGEQVCPICLDYAIIKQEGPSTPQEVAPDVAHHLGSVPR